MIKPSPMPSVALAIMFFVSAGLPSFQVPASNDPVILMAMTEITTSERGHFYAKAQINNSNIDVLVDTGASLVALSYEDADKAGLNPETLDYNVDVSTANGQTKAARALLRKVTIDNVRVADVEAVVMPKGALKGTLLGMSFLSRLSSFKAENGALQLKN